MEIAMISPLRDTFHFDQFPDTSFDAFADPSSFFDPDSFFHFDACAEGLDPEAEPTEQVPEATTTSDVLPTHVSDLESLLGNAETMSAPASTVSPRQLMLTLPGEPSETQQQSHAAVACDLSLVLPSTEPAQPEDDFGALFAELPGSSSDALQLSAASWPADEIDAAFTWNPEIDAAEPDLFAHQPRGGLLPVDGIYDTFDAFDPFDSIDTFAESKQDLTSSAAFSYPSPQGTEVFPASQAQPKSTESRDSLFPDVASISTDDITLTFDENSVDFLCSLPPIVSLTTPQSVPPGIVPVATASSTTELVHPMPRSPNYANFIHRLGKSLTDATPSSILDSQGLIDVPAVSSSYLTPAHTPARDLTTPVVDGKVLKRIPRPAKAKDVDASDWYDALPEAPAAWGGHDPKNPVFQYNKEGELLPNLRFSREQILYYMKARRDQGLPLTLWIQNVPHGCKTRVGDDRLRACRWSGCPAYKGTILKGFWRVCFDERPATSGKQHDPYHNAGYMHLWCLDRCFDLFEIAHAFDLKPDTRYFEKEERNPMAMTRDHDELVMEFEKWRKSQQAAYEEWQKLCKMNKILDLPTENRMVEKEAKLWHMLTTKHLALETPVRSNMRKQRNGISIDKHKGDLTWYVERVEEKKIAKKGFASCEEVDSEDDDVLESQVGKFRSASSPKRKLEDREFDAADDASLPQAASASKRPRRSHRSGLRQ